jgi:hypothetical protein
MAQLKGVYGVFRHPDDLIHAATRTNERAYKHWDCFTPYPVHGLDPAMGLTRSWLPWLAFGGGMTGLLIAITLQTVVMTMNWPMNFGGRPFFAFPDFVPIMFELTVLLAGLCTFFGVFLSQGMPTMAPLILDKRFTDDRFGLWIASDNDGFDLAEVKAFITDLGADEVHEHREEDEA